MNTKNLSRTTRSRLLAATMIALAVPATLVGMAGPASADTTKCVYEGNDRACGTEYSSSLSTLEVCDNEADGNGVYGLIWGDHASDPVKVRDTNGSATGCGTGSIKDSIFAIQICEDDLGDDTCKGVYFP